MKLPDYQDASAEGAYRPFGSPRPDESAGNPLRLPRPSAVNDFEYSSPQAMLRHISNQMKLNRNV